MSGITIRLGTVDDAEIVAKHNVRMARLAGLGGVGVGGSPLLPNPPSYPTPSYSTLSYSTHHPSQAMETEQLALDPATVVEGCRAILSDGTKGFVLISTDDVRPHAPGVDAPSTRPGGRWVAALPVHPLCSQLFAPHRSSLHPVLTPPRLGFTSSRQTLNSATWSARWALNSTEAPPRPTPTPTHHPSNSLALRARWFVSTADDHVRVVRLEEQTDVVDPVRIRRAGEALEGHLQGALPARAGTVRGRGRCRPPSLR